MLTLNLIIWTYHFNNPYILSIDSCQPQYIFIILQLDFHAVGAKYIRFSYGKREI